MPNDDTPAFHTIPISLTAEQHERVSDLALVLELMDDELVQLAAVAKIEEMFAGLQSIKGQLAEPDEEDADARFQHLGALKANHAAKCALDPEFKARMDEAQAEIDREREEQKKQYFF